MAPPRDPAPPGRRAGRRTSGVGALVRLRDDGALRQQLGAAARRAAPEYCWEREAPVLAQVYAELEEARP